MVGCDRLARFRIIVIVFTLDGCHWFRLCLCTLAPITFYVISEIALPSFTVVNALTQDMVLKTVLKFLKRWRPLRLSLCPLAGSLLFRLLLIDNVPQVPRFAEEISSPDIPEYSVFVLLG